MKLQLGDLVRVSNGGVWLMQAPSEVDESSWKGLCIRDAKQSSLHATGETFSYFGRDSDYHEPGDIIAHNVKSYEHALAITVLLGL